MRKRRAEEKQKQLERFFFIRFNGNESHAHKLVPFNKVRLFPHCNTRVSRSLQSVSQSVNNGILRKRPGQSVAVSNA